MSYSEVIYEVWLPAAIRFGISFDSFWCMNPRIINLYQDSYIKKMEEQMEMENWYAWIQGQYHMASIAAAIGGRKSRYPQKPFAIFEEKCQVSGEEKFLLWVEEYNRRFENKEKQNDTERP